MNAFDGVQNLKLAEVDNPKPGRGDLLLRIRFAALNPADSFLAQGMYPARPPLPHILGRDAVGEVLEVGSDVVGIRAGDTVGILRCDVGVNTWGTLAEHTVVPAASVAPVPESWSPEEMACAPLTFLTAWQSLTQWADPPAPPHEGSTLLVTGASGGVGVAAVLLAKTMKLTVIGLSRSVEKGARLRELGADLVANPETEDWHKRLKAALHPKAVDLVVDNVGGPQFNQVLATLGYGGRISVVGRSGGAVPEFNTGSLFFRRLRVGGVAVGDYAAEDAQAAWKEIVTRLKSVNRKPVIDRVFAFEDVKEGFARLAQGPMGKVVIQVAE